MGAQAEPAQYKIKLNLYIACKCSKCGKLFSTNLTDDMKTISDIETKEKSIASKRYHILCTLCETEFDIGTIE